MEDINTGEVLCIPGKKKNYAVEFSYLEEISQSLLISSVPCLPDFFCGMINFKGSIIPVGWLEEPKIREGKEIIMILRHDRFMLGVLLGQDVFIASVGEEQRIRAPQETGDCGIWKEKAIYQVEGRLFSLIDVEKTLEDLVLYQ